MLFAALVCAVLAFGTALMHYEGLLWTRRLCRAISLRHRFALMAAFACVLALHVAEIAAFAGGYWALTAVGGGFAGSMDGGPVDYFYFSAENYSTLGYGDITPLGPARMLAAVEPLSGLILLAWSGAFLFGLLHERHTLSLDDKRKTPAAGRKRRP
ncbi:MAG: potassium channel family protein [Hyphomicrobiales bacterium]|nr:potassium channel family protein [Hyphomicrobiales bacterium]